MVLLLVEVVDECLGDFELSEMVILLLVFCV